MAKEVLFVLTDEFADWEAAFIAPVLRHGLTPSSGPTQYTPKTLSIAGECVRSMGGVTVVADYTLQTMPDDFGALIMPGGEGWQAEETQRLVPVIERAMARGALVAGICNASLFLGKSGFLNNIRHTGNTLDEMQAWGGARYTGEALYEERQAVRDGNVITANGTACLEFTRECLLGLQVETPAQVEGFYLFNKRGFCDE